MGFSENLSKIRKDRHLTQDELAELLEVSRQAVSKWEQGLGYPEVEKLLQISSKLDVSLDFLMGDHDSDHVFETPVSTRKVGEITIRSPHENVIIRCSKVATSQKMSGGKNAPQYALFATDKPGHSVWDTTTFLAWYADFELISKEVEEIYNAMLRGDQAYTLQYSARCEKRGLSVKML